MGCTCSGSAGEVGNIYRILVGKSLEKWPQMTCG
jgi:hypothetical protein